MFLQEALGVGEVTISGRSATGNDPERGRGNATAMATERRAGVPTERCLVAPRTRRTTTAGPPSAAEQQPPLIIGSDDNKLVLGLKLNKVSYGQSDKILAPSS